MIPIAPQAHDFWLTDTTPAAPSVPQDYSRDEAVRCANPMVADSYQPVPAVEHVGHMQERVLTQRGFV